MDRPSDPHAQGLRIEARLAAGRAGDVLPVAAEKDPDLDLVFLGLEPVEEALDARSSRRRRRGRSAATPFSAF